MEYVRIIFCCLPQNFLHRQVPIVYIDRRIESENISWVASDNVQGAYDLVSYLCSTGVQEIYYLGGLETISTLMAGAVKG